MNDQWVGCIKSQHKDSLTKIVILLLFRNHQNFQKVGVSLRVPTDVPRDVQYKV